MPSRAPHLLAGFDDELAELTASLLGSSRRDDLRRLRRLRDQTPGTSVWPQRRTGPIGDLPLCRAWRSCRLHDGHDSPLTWTCCGPRSSLDQVVEVLRPSRRAVPWGHDAEQRCSPHGGVSRATFVAYDRRLPTRSGLTYRRTTAAYSTAAADQGNPGADIDFRLGGAPSSPGASCTPGAPDGCRGHPCLRPGRKHDRDDQEAPDEMDVAPSSRGRQHRLT